MVKGAKGVPVVKGARRAAASTCACGSRPRRTCRASSCKRRARSAARDPSGRSTARPRSSPGPVSRRSPQVAGDRIARLDLAAPGAARAGARAHRAPRQPDPARRRGARRLRARAAARRRDPAGRGASVPGSSGGPRPDRPATGAPPPLAECLRAGEEPGPSDSARRSARAALVARRERARRRGRRRGRPPHGHRARARASSASSRGPRATSPASSSAPPRPRGPSACARTASS